ncbi:MAG TPA: flavodoxin-dependent (E)-4-hydroxy-3-methylbut-2-enyl-diphosphate synthase, partial [Chloroflexota bacterium]|nr:flavodoxin-dependent (E)-4-hydroxy-3-methylbut-2-enyl-diphosphate synthase [Chloroflexota bacterium]
RALELNAADGLLRARPDALSVLVRGEEDAAALRRLRAALDAAPTAETGPDLPLVVCVPADAPVLGAAVEDAAAVCLNVGSGPSPALANALAVVARARRPLVLEVTPDPAPDQDPDPTAAAAAGESDPALPAGRAVARLLDAAAAATAAGNQDLVLSVTARDPALALRTYRLLSGRLAASGLDYPLHLVAWPDGDAQEVLLRASVLLGALLCDGIGDSVQIMGATRGGPGRALDDATRARLAFNVLQGAGVRLTKTEFVACPSCGRTLFDLQETTERIQRQTGHLKGVKIAVMGCIVNGPGEMADADFGYVGGAPGKVNLYVGKECVEKGVPAGVADARLIDLIRRHGKWVDVP